MADEAAGPRSSGGRRQRTGGRGASHHNSSERRQDGRNEGQNRGGRGHGGGGGGRGRGGRGRDRNNTSRTQQGVVTTDSGGGGEQPPPDPKTGPGTSGDRPIGDASSKTPEGESKGKQLVAAATDEPDDGEVCFICASTVEHTSVAPCNHRTCHICALRMRALYKNRWCSHCRTESPFVIFTDDPTKRFEDFAATDLVRTDDNLGIKYEKDEIFEDTVILLRYNCPDKDCDTACFGWPDLHRHVKSKHGKTMCDLCTRHKKLFTHEHELFTTAQLRKHEKYGDDNPGAIDQSGFKGHPECEFCRKRFYGDDELYEHCRDNHERCHICDRRANNRRQQYFINYDALEEHFQKDHFLCLDKECLEHKFIVFETQMDLKAHQLEAHPNGLSKDARRDARLVDMSTFDFRSPYQPQRQRREGRGAGRGRDPNADALPLSSAQPLRRDEIAYQRQIAVQSAQSLSTRTFGGQLTPREPPPVRNTAAGPTPAQAAAAATNAASRASSRSTAAPVAAMNDLSLNRDSNVTSLSPQDQARRLRHAAVIERASNLLQNDAGKTSEFRTKVSNYRTSVISATELIDSFFSLFDAPSSELGKLIKELAEIYEDEQKKNALLKAWNDWRAINEDYPALPGPSGGTLPGMSSSTTGAGGNRVLRLKSSTAQSSRSAVGRTGSLSSNNNSSITNPFPPLSSPSTSTNILNNNRSSSANIPTWTSTPATRPTVTTTSQPPSSSSYARPAARAQSGPVPRTSDRNAFPALPAAPKPNTLMAGLTRGTVRWDDSNRRGPPPAAWGNNNSPASNPNETVDESGSADAGAGGGKKGKGKKGKQVLLQFG